MTPIEDLSPTKMNLETLNHTIVHITTINSLTITEHHPPIIRDIIPINNHHMVIPTKIERSLPLFLILIIILIIE